jgi:hypothetical protein
LSRRLRAAQDRAQPTARATERNGSQGTQAGGPDLVFRALGRIGHWIEVNGYRIAGPYREIGLDLPTSGRFDEMVIEVQMPIEQRDTSSDLFTIQPEEASTLPERNT